MNLIVALIDRKKMRNKVTETYFKTAYSFLLERFEYFLEDFESCYGSVIMDEAKDSPEIKALKHLHKEDLKEGVRVWHGDLQIHDENGKIKTIGKNLERREPLTRIVSNLIYEKDDDSNFLQVADLVAHAFATEYNRNIDKFSSHYKELLRRGPNGKVEGYGLKIFPK